MRQHLIPLKVLAIQVVLASPETKGLAGSLDRKDPKARRDRRLACVVRMERTEGNIKMVANRIVIQELAIQVVRDILDSEATCGFLVFAQIN